MTRRPDLARAVSQLDRHRSGNPNNPPLPPLTWGDSMVAAGAAVGATVAQALRDAEAGMRQLALIAPGWRVGS